MARPLDLQTTGGPVKCFLLWSGRSRIASSQEIFAECMATRTDGDTGGSLASATLSEIHQQSASDNLPVQHLEDEPGHPRGWKRMLRRSGIRLSPAPNLMVRGNHWGQFIYKCKYVPCVPYLTNRWWHAKKAGKARPASGDSLGTDPEAALSLWWRCYISLGVQSALNGGSARTRPLARSSHSLPPSNWEPRAGHLAT